MNLDFFVKPAVLAITVIVFVAASLYAVIDAPTEAQTINRMAIEAGPATSQSSGEKAASVTSLIAGLEAKLAQDPDDAKGWLLLAKSHDHLGNRDAAWAAYARAKELGMSDDTFEIKLAANIGQLIPNN